MTFHVGQKVVAIDGRPVGFWMRLYCWRHPPPGEHPITGNVYTVVNIIPDNDDGCSLELLELTSPATKWWEAGFCGTGFRPAVNPKTDISVFTSLLRSKPKSRVMVLTNPQATLSPED